MAIDPDFLKSIGVEDDEVATKIAQKAQEDEKGLVQKRDELLDKLTKQKETLAQYEGVDLDEYSKLKQRVAEMEAEGMSIEERIEKAKQEAAKEWEDKYSQTKNQLDELTEREKSRFRNEAVFRAVGDKGDAELILDVIAQRNLVETLDKDGETVLQVKSLDGKELESIDKLIEEMKASDRYSRLFNSSGLSGSGARPSGSGSGSQDDGLFGAKRMAAARNK